MKDLIRSTLSDVTICTDDDKEVIYVQFTFIMSKRECWNGTNENPPFYKSTFVSQDEQKYQFLKKVDYATAFILLLDNYFSSPHVQIIDKAYKNFGQKLQIFFVKNLD